MKPGEKNSKIASGEFGDREAGAEINASRAVCFTTHDAQTFCADCDRVGANLGDAIESGVDVESGAAAEKEAAVNRDAAIESCVWASASFPPGPDIFSKTEQRRATRAADRQARPAGFICVRQRLKIDLLHRLLCLIRHFHLCRIYILDHHGRSAIHIPVVAIETDRFADPFAFGPFQERSLSGYLAVLEAWFE